MTTQNDPKSVFVNKPSVINKAPIQVDKAKTLINLMLEKAMVERMKMLLNTPEMYQRFLAVMTSAVNVTPRLKECTVESVIGAMIKSAQVKLEPNTVLGRAWLIPRQKRGVWESSWELGYKGSIELGMRSNIIGSVPNHTVYEADTFEIDYGSGILIHKPSLDGDRGRIRGYWAKWVSKHSQQQFDFRWMSVYDMDKFVKQYVKNSDSEYSPWKTAFNEMAKKTVIKRVLKHGPQSVEDFAHAYEADGKVHNADTGILQDSTASAVDILTTEMDGPEPLPMDPKIEEDRQLFIKQIMDRLGKIKNEDDIARIEIKTGLTAAGLSINNIVDMDLTALRVFWDDAFGRDA